MSDTYLHELLLRRHSIRRYTEQAIEGENVKMILEAALLAPSSKSTRPWQFVVVEDRAVLEKLSECKSSGAMPVKGAALAVVVCASPERTDMFVEDASIAAVFMQLQAEALGVGSCWIQVRERYSADGEPAENNVREILGIPSDMAVECIVTFGYPAETRKPVDPSKLLWEKVHLGEWKQEQID